MYSMTLKILVVTVELLGYDMLPTLEKIRLWNGY